MGKEEFVSGCTPENADGKAKDYTCEPILKKADGSIEKGTGPVKVRVDENRNVVVLNSGGASNDVLNHLKRYLRDNTI